MQHIKLCTSLSLQWCTPKPAASMAQPPADLAWSRAEPGWADARRAAAGAGTAASNGTAAKLRPAEFGNPLVVVECPEGFRQPLLALALLGFGVILSQRTLMRRIHKRIKHV